jgi:hypothetical protein
MTDTNEIVRSTIIWSLEETIKKQDAEIERLRSAVVQYRDDLFYLPTGEEKLRRIKMVKQLLEGK